MRVLWIGHGAHRPAPDFPFVLRDGFFWHYPFRDGEGLYQYLQRSGGHFIGELSEFSLEEGLRLRGAPVDPGTVDCVLFTWNCFGLSASELAHWRRLEQYLRMHAPQAGIINSLAEFPTVTYKTAFFERLDHLGLGDNLPGYAAAGSVFSLLSGKVRYPLIVRSNFDTGGRNSYLCRNIPEALLRYRAVRKGLSGRKLPAAGDGAAPELVLVHYYDNFYPDFGCHASFRIIFQGGRLAFLYPHVSTLDWCIHTDMGARSPRRETFLQICEFIYDFVGRKYEVFLKVAEGLELGTLALDFIVHRDRPIFLEAELKYGCDVNFIEGPLKRYGLDLGYFSARLREIDSREISFASILSGKESRHRPLPTSGGRGTEL